jgi:ACS family D-galactonate transporter-like MFS transporter
MPAHRAGEGTPTFAAILRQREFWAASAGHFSGNYLFYFLISWLPFYLVHERHLSMASMAATAGVLYSVDSLSSVLTGWATDRFIRGGGSPSFVRKVPMVVGYALAALSLGACAMSGPHTYLPCLVAIGIGSGIANAGNIAFGQTLAGPRAAGRWIGLQNGIANLSGIMGPALTGFLIDTTGNFGAPLAVAAAVAVMGGLSWTIGVRKLQQVDWAAAQRLVQVP